MVVSYKMADTGSTVACQHRGEQEMEKRARWSLAMTPSASSGIAINDIEIHLAILPLMRHEAQRGKVGE